MMLKISLLFALYLTRHVIAALPWIYTFPEMDAHLRSCLSDDYYKYNITNNLDTNFTLIQPFEWRSTDVEGQDAPLLSCLQFFFPYHVWAFVPNQKYAADTGMYDDNEDTDYEIPTEESQDRLEPYMWEDGIAHDNDKFNHWVIKES